MAAKKNQLRVCVVIPAFNESSVIGDVITDITKIFNSSTYNTEVVVVNDASKDQTATVAEQHGATVINHILNSGAGGATATGLRYAELSDFDIAVTMDADGQHLSKDVLTGVDRIIKEDTDLLIGSRLINTDGMSQIKILGNKGLSFITYLLFGINVTDSQSGLRVYSRKAIENLHWKTNGYEFCSEMLWRAKQLHLSVAEYPITAVYTNYSKGKGQNNWNAINIVKSLAQRRLLEIFE